MIEVSPHDPATAYLAATRYKLDDNKPMLYKTTDYGENWVNISRGIPEHDYTRVVRADPGRPGLLYAGTETGVYVSFDDGVHWKSIRANLPRVPVYDLAIKANDLIAATHGRSFWILEDLTQVHQITSGMDEKPFQLLKPRPTYRVRSPFRNRKPTPGKNYRPALGADVAYTEVRGSYGETIRKFLDAGENPPEGIVVHYYLKEGAQKVTLSVLDSEGQEIKAFSSAMPEDESGEGMTDPRTRAEPGMSRFVWDMRYPLAREVPRDKSMEEVLVGPLAKPGTYQVKLTVDGESQTETFEILKDPRASAEQKEFDAQFQLLIKIRDKLSQTHDAINRLRGISEQVVEWTRRAQNHSSDDTMSNAAETLREKLSAIESELIQVDYKGARDRLDLPVKLNRKLAELASVVASADFSPPKQTYQVFDYLEGTINQHLDNLDKIVEQDLSHFMEIIQELHIPAIVPSPR